jgi:hypothetical protein
MIMKKMVVMAVGVVLSMTLVLPAFAASKKGTGNTKGSKTVQKQRKLSKRNLEKIELEKLKAMKRQAVIDATK